MTDKLLESILQKNIFLAGEGDAWYERNSARIAAEDLPGHDPVLTVLAEMGVVAREVLEIGCSNGWRLDQLVHLLGARGAGLDPSAQAVAEGRARNPKLELAQGTADKLPYADGRFDLVIYGFCLYLCDRADLFKIAEEGDRVLADGGHLVVYDFSVRHPYRRVYEPDPRLYSYKMDHAAFFVSHPAYTIVRTDTFGTSGKVPHGEDDALSVVVLRKNLAEAFPPRDAA